MFLWSLEIDVALAQKVKDHGSNEELNLSVCESSWNTKTSVRTWSDQQSKAENFDRGDAAEVLLVWNEQTVMKENSLNLSWISLPAEVFINHHIFLFRKTLMLSVKNIQSLGCFTVFLLFQFWRKQI